MRKTQEVAIATAAAIGILITPSSEHVDASRHPKATSTVEIPDFVTLPGQTLATEPSAEQPQLTNPSPAEDSPSTSELPDLNLPTASPQPSKTPSTPAPPVGPCPAVPSAPPVEVRNGPIDSEAKARRDRNATFFAQVLQPILRNDKDFKLVTRNHGGTTSPGEFIATKNGKHVMTFFIDVVDGKKHEYTISFGLAGYAEIILDGRCDNALISHSAHSKGFELVTYTKANQAKYYVAAMLKRMCADNPRLLTCSDTPPPYPDPARPRSNAE